jgi:hypothetical protein
MAAPVPKSGMALCITKQATTQNNICLLHISIMLEQKKMTKYFFLGTIIAESVS